MPGSSTEHGNAPTKDSNQPSPPVSLENKPGTPGFVEEAAAELDAVITERGNLFAERMRVHNPYPGPGEKAVSNVMKARELRMEEDMLDQKETALRLLFHEHDTLINPTIEPDLSTGKTDGPTSEA